MSLALHHFILNLSCEVKLSYDGASFGRSAFNTLKRLLKTYLFRNPFVKLYLFSSLNYVLCILFYIVYY